MLPNEAVSGEHWVDSGLVKSHFWKFELGSAAETDEVRPVIIPPDRDDHFGGMGKETPLLRIGRRGGIERLKVFQQVYKKFFCMGILLFRLIFRDFRFSQIEPEVHVWTKKRKLILWSFEFSDHKMLYKYQIWMNQPVLVCK